MSSQQEQACAAIDMLLDTVGILSSALESKDDNNAHEAVTILLMQCMTTYGPEHPVMQQFFPVLDTIKRRIDAMELDAAQRQSQIFAEQLREVKDLVLGTK